MTPKKSSASEYWRKIFETVPLPMLVVDAEMRILDSNPAAKALLGKEQEVILRRKGGEALNCIYATRSSACCTAGPICKDCVIRQAVTAAFTGAPVARKRAMLERVQDGQVKSIQLLVTSSSFEYQDQPQALLILEDVSELMALRGLLPICARCKKIRDTQRYWHQLEQYCHQHLSLEFTHSVCPECAKELYGYQK